MAGLRIGRHRETLCAPLGEGENMSIAHQEFLKICSDCGEIFDANIETEALHHTQAEHKPLLPVSYI